MKFTVEKRDLFTVPKDYTLCHCISADFALGAGIAKKFALKGVKKELLNLYKKGIWCGNGYALICHYDDIDSIRSVVNLVTKEKYYYKPTYQTLKESLVDMKCCYLVNFGEHASKIAMPKIGCGLDRLKWDDVEHIIKDVFADTDVKILVCDRKSM